MHWNIELLTAAPGISINLPKLKKVILTNLQNLSHICANVAYAWPALEELSIDGCRLLTGLSIQWENAKRLRKLLLANLENLKTICANNVASEWLALEELNIDGCPNLTQLPFFQRAIKLRTLTLINLSNLTIPTNALFYMPALEELQVCGCDKIYELPFGEDSSKGLKKLTLSGLPRLRTLSRLENQTFKWPALEVLEIRDCPRLAWLPFNKDSASNLKFIIA